MSTGIGPKIDEAVKLACQACGQLMFGLVKKKFSRKDILLSLELLEKSVELIREALREADT